MADDRLDLVVFGATGVTGQYVVEDLIKSIDKENKGLTWGIAGRSAPKLKQVLEDVSKYLSKNLDDIPIIEADVKNEKSILAMSKRARVILNCVGPYRFYGEVVVKSCIETKTHHVDLAGEPQFLEEMQIKYHEKAAQAGVLIVGACGFDSIPVDLGIYFLKQHFDGELAFVDAYAKIKSGPSGMTVNHGTWDSAIHALGNWSELSDIRAQLYGNFYKKRFPRYRHKNAQKFAPHIPAEIGKLTVPFWDTDKNVARRTHLHNYIEHQERPIQVASYLVVGSWLAAIGMGFVGLIFVVLSYFKFGRQLLEDYPHIFTFGNVSKDGPSREQVNETSFQMILVGRGWPEKLASPTDEPSAPPSKTIVGRVTGPEPAYAATSTFLVQSAITLLKEQETIPFAGGVLTPGLAFRETTLVERLKRHSINFEIIPTKSV